MTTITRERLEQALANPTKITFNYGETLELARIALASLGAEPVAECHHQWKSGGANKLQRQKQCVKCGRVELVAPPAPVVPEKMSYQDGVVFVLNNGMSSIERGTVARRAWNACRAALLHGIQPVSNRDELPVIGWLRSDYNSDDKRDPNAPLFMLGRNDPSETWGVKYIPLTGNSPVIPDGLALVPKRLTAENGAKSVLSGEFSETKFINCPECFGDGECETCDGSGRIEITVPVSWTNIKAIWAKGVEHFAAAPRQEDE